MPAGRILRAGDSTELGGSTLIAHEIPGHDRGQLAFFHKQDGVLFSADGIPIPGEMPIYDDVAAQVSSLRRMRALEGVQVLLSAWGETRRGEEEAKRMLDDSLNYVQRVHSLTLEALEACGGDGPEAIAKQVHAGLKLHPSEFTPLFLSTVQAHMAEKERRDVLAG